MYAVIGISGGSICSSDWGFVFQHSVLVEDPAFLYKQLRLLYQRKSDSILSVSAAFFMICIGVVKPMLEHEWLWEEESGR